VAAGLASADGVVLGAGVAVELEELLDDGRESFL
jgi:hypothetical protein